MLFRSDGLVVERGVTFLLTVPVLGREYFSSAWATRAGDLRTVIFCGEPLPKDLVELVARVVSRAACLPACPAVACWVGLNLAPPMHCIL